MYYTLNRLKLLQIYKKIKSQNRKIRVDLATHAGRGTERSGGFGDRGGSRYGDRGGDDDDRTAGDWRSGPPPPPR